MGSYSHDAVDALIVLDDDNASDAGPDASSSPDEPTFGPTPPPDSK